jgi:exodeoxyribonuclease V beta subunit
MTGDHTARVPFHLTMDLPKGRTVIEASAGTGKTYTLTALIVRYIAERNVPVDQLLVVTFTRAAASELRDRTRSMLGLAALALQPGANLSDTSPWLQLMADPNLSETERDQRRQRVLEAIAHFDDLTITTIHGFCQQAIAQLGLRAGGDPNAVLIENINDIVAEVCRDVSITELADEPHRLTPSAAASSTTSTTIENQLIAAVRMVLSNPGALLVPNATTTMVSDAATQALALRWSQLVAHTCNLVHERQQARSQIGYDAIISGLRDALVHPVRGPVVAEQLADRYGVVLVDEFQDTDRVQWQVFKTAFANRTLITVGDPKQAIYRFRGADVHAYLNATDETITYSLATNHRSDQQLLRGLEHLLTGAQFGDPRIAFVPVQPAEKSPVNALGTQAAIQLRAVPMHPDLFTPKQSALAMPKVRQLILADLVARTVHLLDNGSIAAVPRDHAAGDQHTSPRPVLPGDIAVLVPTHGEAEQVATAFRRAGIPAVRTRTGSVLATAALTQWRLLLAALARPAHAPSVRGAALGWFLQTDPLELIGANADNVLANLQERVATMAVRLHRVGLASFYDEAKSSSGLLQNLLSAGEGERHLTDLDHIAELLTGALPPGAEAGQALRVLDDLVTHDDDRAEATMRRIDSDARAVQITTIHSAKGLEYPIVLLPFAFKRARAPITPHSYTSVGGQRTIDVASLVLWDEGLLDPTNKATARDQKARVRHTRFDIEGDELRLLYVSLTRAMHRLEVWWAPMPDAPGSALARVLLDREGAGAVRNTPVQVIVGSRGGVSEGKREYTELSAGDMLAQFGRLAAGSDGTIELTELGVAISRTSWSGRDEATAQPLHTASTGGRGSIADHAWKRWSFTRLSGSLDARTDQSGATAPAIAPLGGGSDEPTEPTDGIAMTNLVARLADAPAGTTFGTFVHATLESLDFTAPNLVEQLRTSLAHNARRDGLPVNVDHLAQGLADALHTPLGPLFDQRSLADIAPNDRLAELTFDLPMARALSPAESPNQSSTPAWAIADVLLQTLPTHDPLLPFASAMAAESGELNIAGWMYGSIDAVVRIPRNNAHTYLVIDYKTNRLHQPGAAQPVTAYSPRHLLTAMEHHRYPLQALLYTVAVHRYLRWRLGSAYDPEQHLGGIGYLFLRGMVGPDTPTVDDVPHGVFSWRPPTATILGLDALFATGSGS